MNTEYHSSTDSTDIEERWAQRARHHEDALLLAWLEGELTYRDILLTFATDETRQKCFEFAGRNPTDQALIDADRAHVERLFCAIFFGACPSCHWPVVTFVDGFSLDWPARSPHRCAGPEPLPARVEAGGAPSRQHPSWKRATTC